ncbi:hypothetical protein BK022_08495 [Methylorubrum extorquens]|uniref:Uncharacterized protein n=1 Tax=Methylorubrum extorquens TaxID=408 RepID=A0A1S1P6S3_METEX|nr:hypothetical protein BK022_08495 [Methylorubrum extorquens]
MPTYWQKTAWWPGDLDPVSGLPLPGALPRGIYCEDRESFSALRRQAYEQEPEMTYGIDGTPSLVGTPVGAPLCRFLRETERPHASCGSWRMA